MTKTGINTRMRIRILAAAAIVLALAASIAFAAMPSRGTARANSAAPMWYGGGITGSLSSGDECPLEVKHEALTFDIPTLPNAHYGSVEDFKAYNGTVTAEYTFYNPEDYDVTAKMMFPFGIAPQYGGIIDYEACFDEIAKSYTVKADGNPIETRLRHTYIAACKEYGHYEFETLRDLGKLCDGFCDDEFFEPEMTVTKYTYVARGINYGQVAYAVTAAEYDNEKTRVLSNAELLDFVRFGKNVMTGDSIDIYAIGDPFETDPRFTVFDGMLLRNEVNGEMYLAGKTATTFKDFALSFRCTDSTVGENDWYNAFVFALNREIQKNEYIHYSTGFVGSLNAQTFDITNNLLRWYEYEMTVPSRSTVVNAVTAPAYPSIQGNGYYFTYLLSPATSWKSFGTLDLKIRTNSVLTQCYASPKDGINHDNLNDKLTLKDGVYSASLDSLPNGELYFSISSGSERGNVFYDTVNSVAYFLSFFRHIAEDRPFLTLTVTFGATLFLTAAICAIVLPATLGKDERK